MVYASPASCRAWVGYLGGGAEGRAHSRETRTTMSEGATRGWDNKVCYKDIY